MPISKMCISVDVRVQGFVSCTAYFIMGWLMKRKGPVFVSSFNPLSMVIIAILGSFFIAEELFLGRYA